MTDDDGAGAWTVFEAAYDGWQTMLYLLVGHEGGVLAAVVSGPGTAEEIAARAGSDPRMTLEWLRVMTVAGFIDVDDDGLVFTARAELDEISDLPGIDTPAGIGAAMFRRTPEVLDGLAGALRSGGGVAPEVYGPAFTRLQNLSSLTTGPAHLVPDMLGPVAGLVERLSVGCRVVEVGCGGGWALETLADAFPTATFTGYDVDEYGLGLARDRLARFDGRCRVEKRDIDDLAERSADVVLAIDLVHDLSDPTSALVRIRRALTPGGIFIMAETDASGDFSVDRRSPHAWQYGPSFARCIPTTQYAGGPALGSMWGRPAAQALLRETGFVHLTVHSSEPGYAVFSGRAPSS